MAETYHREAGKWFNEACDGSNNNDEVKTAGEVIKTKPVTLEIFRFDPSKDPHPKYKTYNLLLEEEITLLMALKYIYLELDNTLAFRDYCCWAGPLCGSCLLTVNGKPTYSCSTPLKGGEKLIIEPLKGFPVIRDLVVADREHG